MLVCASCCIYCTRDRGCSAHPVFPAPSDLEGEVFLQNFGRIASRDREVVSVNPSSPRTRGPIRRGRDYLARWSTTFLQQLTFVAMGPGSRPGRRVDEGAQFTPPPS